MRDLRRLPVEAAERAWAGLSEPKETYVWENLSAPSFEAGAAGAFGKKKLTTALRHTPLRELSTLTIWLNCENRRRIPEC